jgi:cholesterol oxidase
VFDHDFIVVGSGFGGSVAGLRLVEKGYAVLMLEKGRAIPTAELPKTNWDLKRWMWLPQLGFRGFFKMTILPHITILSGVALGGGSVTYAAALPVPPEKFFRSGEWKELADWSAELAPHYATAKRMLGVARNPKLAEADLALKEVAIRRGEEHKFEPTEVGVFFGEPGETVPDPYFGGAGPARRGCTHCGGCMLGCRFNAKNTLEKNYLHLARAKGLQIQSDTEVTAVRALAGGGYRIEALEGASLFGRRRVELTCRQVVLAGGVLGTVDLLLRMKSDPDGLPKLSDQVGCNVRTNSESFIGVITRRPDADLSRGLAIGSIYHCGENEYVQPVRYSDGSGFFRLLALPHVPGERTPERLARLAAIFFRHPFKILRAYTTLNMARKMSILMYMRTEEGTLRLERAWHGGLTTRRESGAAPVASFDAATRLGHESSEVLDGMPFALVQETLFNIPTTAHVLGGAGMGADRTSGVIDEEHRVFGYDGLYVVDGSAVAANPGVNPSLTITAMAERAMSFIPERPVALGRKDRAEDARAAS